MRNSFMRSLRGCFLAASGSLVRFVRGECGHTSAIMSRRCWPVIALRTFWRARDRVALTSDADLRWYRRAMRITILRTISLFCKFVLVLGNLFLYA